MRRVAAALGVLGLTLLVTVIGARPARAADDCDGSVAIWGVASIQVRAPAQNVWYTPTNPAFAAWEFQWTPSYGSTADIKVTWEKVNPTYSATGSPLACMDQVSKGTPTALAGNQWTFTYTGIMPSGQKVLRMKTEGAGLPYNSYGAYFTFHSPPTLAITSPSPGQKFPINAGTLTLNATITPPPDLNTWVGCQTQRRVGNSWQSTFGPTNFPASSFPSSLPISPGYFGQAGRYRIKCAVSGIGQESGWREFEIMLALNPDAMKALKAKSALGASQQEGTSQPGGNQSKTAAVDPRPEVTRSPATDEFARELTALADRLRGLGVNPEAKRLLTEVQTLQKGLAAKTGDPAALLARLKTLKEETTKLEASLRRIPKATR